MPQTHYNSGEETTSPDVIPGHGPGAHEDLTIAEEVEAMRCGNEHRPGQQCFVDSKEEKHWVDEAKLSQFLREEGARHSSDYKSIHGTDWEQDFFTL